MRNKVLGERRSDRTSRWAQGHAYRWPRGVTKVVHQVGLGCYSVASNINSCRIADGVAVHARRLRGARTAGARCAPDDVHSSVPQLLPRAGCWARRSHSILPLPVGSFQIHSLTLVCVLSQFSCVASPGLLPR